MKTTAHRNRAQPARWPLLPAVGLALTVLAPGANPLRAQVEGARVVVGQNILITEVGDEAPHIEPHLVVNPVDPSNLLVAAMAVPLPGGAMSLRVFASFDAGSSWTRQRLESAEPPGVDPWLDVAADGTVYLVSIAPEQVRRSTDGGRTWSVPTALPRGEAGPYDYTKIIVDDTDGPFAGRVYVWASQADRLESGERVWPVALLRSSDGARTFSWPEHVLPNNFNNQNGALVVLSDGHLIASFHEIAVAGEFLRSPRLWVTRSGDGGQTFSNPFLVAEDFSADSPRLAVDRSHREFHDRVYVSWIQYRPAPGLFLSYSDDRGATWAEPRAITEIEVKEGGYLPHGPMIAVTHQGIIGLTWQDPRHDPQGKCFALYFTASVDGGDTFLPERRVSSEISCSDTAGNQLSVDQGGPTVARRFRDGGDYQGLAALTDGSFQAVWAGSRGGAFQLWTSRIRVLDLERR